MAHRPEDSDLFLNGFLNGDRLRRGGRQLEQLIDDKFFDGQPVRQRPRRDRLSGESLEITLKAGIFPLKQIFNPRILRKHP